MKRKKANDKHKVKPIPERTGKEERDPYGVILTLKLVSGHVIPPDWEYESNLGTERGGMGIGKGRA